MSKSDVGLRRGIPAGAERLLAELTQRGLPAGDLKVAAQLCIALDQRAER